MKRMKIVLAFLLCFSFAFMSPVNAATIKLNKTKVYLVANNVSDDEEEEEELTSETYQLKVSGTKKKVTWKSSKKSVATVTSKGLVTAVSQGKATITAKVAGKTLKCTVYVEEPDFDIDSVKVTYGLDGFEECLPDEVTLYNANHGKITWSSSDESIATINENGEITAKDVGTVIITATYHGFDYTVKYTISNTENEYKLLKETIQNSKRVDSDGNHYLGMRMIQNFTHEDADGVVGVYYVEDTDQLKFVYSQKIDADEDSDYKSSNEVLCMYLNVLKDENATITYEYSGYDDDGEYDSWSAKAKINAVEYDGSALPLRVSGSGSLSKIQDISNNFTTYLEYWDEYLDLYGDTSLTVLGMENYESWEYDE